MKHFHTYSRREILGLTKARRFETKLGEMIAALYNKDEIGEVLQDSAAKYVLFGIAEDIGVRANLGRGGTETAWPAFISSFLNMQSNDFIRADDVLLLGYFDFNVLKFVIEQNAYDENEKTAAYRHAVETIDEEVEALTKIIAGTGKIPVVVGGGHNNAYPLVKGTAKALHKKGLTASPKINAVNLDAHADFRPSEGRHSGNSFRYAMEEGYLEKYSIVGLHENYIQQNVLKDIIQNPSIQFSTYEDIFIRNKKSFDDAVGEGIRFTDNNYTGVELDLDSVENLLSSAETPSGIPSLLARRFIYRLSRQQKTAYIHICEAAAEIPEGKKEDTIGKLISYLIADLLRADQLL